MSNVVRAFNEAIVCGRLDLHEMNIGSDEAVFAAVDVLHTELVELHLSGNVLVPQHFHTLVKAMRNAVVYDLSCCSLDRSVRASII